MADELNINPNVIKQIGSVSTTEMGAGASKSASNPINHGLFVQDIAQSHHFTIHIDGFSSSKFKVPGGTYSEFLPVKSMNLNYVSYENMSIPVSIFGDFPLLNKKRVATIGLSCFDLDNNLFEKELKTWENRCFPKGRFVAYMDDIVRKLTYRGFNTKGKLTLEYYWYVIPSGNVTVSRDYSNNDAKLVNFSLVCVGDGSTCATGSSSGINGNGSGSGGITTEEVSSRINAVLSGQRISDIASRI